MRYLFQIVTLFFGISLFGQIKETKNYSVKVTSKDRIAYDIFFDQSSTPFYLLGIKKFNIKPKTPCQFKILQKDSILFTKTITPSSKDLLEITIDFVKNDTVRIEFESERKTRVQKEHSNYIKSLPDQFVFIPSGSLADQKKIDAFYISKYETTQHLWTIVMGERSGYYVGKNRPVESVNWNQVQEFIIKLNKLSGLKYRLPTTDEWQYAAMGGPGTKDSLYAQNMPIDSVCWYHKHNKKMTSLVGKLTPNSLGLYDMNGNVWEWCSGDPSEKTQIIRGGSLNNAAKYCSNIYYNVFNTTSGGSNIGFRLVLEK